MFSFIYYTDIEENGINTKILTKLLNNEHQYEDITNSYKLVKSMRTEHQIFYCIVCIFKF
jgi:hypothetical protein